MSCKIELHNLLEQNNKGKNDPSCDVLPLGHYYISCGGINNLRTKFQNVQN